MENQLQRLKQRLRANRKFAASKNATVEPEFDSRILERLDKLEATFQRYRSEVDMKMTIIYEILSMNCERMNNKNKSELQKQHDSETLLESWKNIEDLAAHKLSLKILYDINNDMELLEVPDNYIATTKTHKIGVDIEGESTRGKMYKYISTVDIEVVFTGIKMDTSDFSSAELVSEKNVYEKSVDRKKHLYRTGKQSRRTVTVSKMPHAFVLETNEARPRSAVWKNFEIAVNEDWPRPRAICKHCRKAVSGEAHRLRKHIRKCPQQQQ